MSSKATAWAWQQQMKPSSAKLLLMAIADCANPETGLAFPSIDCLVGMTGQDRKTVISGLERLCAMRLAKDTGARVGKTRQIPVYQLAPWVKDWSQSETVGKTGLFETIPDSAAKGPVFGSEESRKRDTEPRRGNLGEEQSPPSPNGEDPPLGELGLFGGELETEPPQPIEEFVVEAWHALKRDFPGVQDIDVLNEDRVNRIRRNAEMVVADRKKRGIAATPESVWTEVFANIRRSTFLTGRDPPGKNYTRPFKLKIEYVLRPREFLAILEDEHEPAGDNFHAADGRRRGPAEQATRRTIERIFAGAE